LFFQSFKSKHDLLHDFVNAQSRVTLPDECTEASFQFLGDVNNQLGTTGGHRGCGQDIAGWRCYILWLKAFTMPFPMFCGDGLYDGRQSI
jgi:hypothetical protein